jgi:Asp/Glu/hydantoin racemase
MAEFHSACSILIAKAARKVLALASNHGPVTAYFGRIVASSSLSTETAVERKTLSSNPTPTPAPTLALIHTSPTLTPSFTELCRRHIPEARLFHIVDESLIQDTIRTGALSKLTMRRLVDQIANAEAAGADAVLVTCSSIGPGVTLAQQLFDIPVLRIDEAMAEAAVQQAHTIGVLATLRTTLDPTTALLRQKAADAGRTVELVECLCGDAFPAVLAGDTETHDRLLRKALVEDLKGVDVIVLAQASMARVVATLAPGALQAQVLSSPEMAVLRARQVLLAGSSPKRSCD